MYDAAFTHELMDQPDKALALPSQVRCSWMAADSYGPRTTGPDVRVV
jgi:hypothetical protein